MPRLLHVADTHLGFQAYTRQTPDGFNQREVDLQDAFRRIVDAAVAGPPDVFVHAGDLFDHPRPNNRAIAFALQQLRRLSEAKIPTVLVSGNHDAPRMRETGSIFRAFEGLPHIHPVYRGVTERFDLGGVKVHAVPQGVTQEAFQRELHALDPAGPGPHVLVVHGTVLGVDGLFSSEFNEYQIPMGVLRPEFSYVALGHFHNHKQVRPNAFYSGSPEFCSFNEAGQTKVAIWADVDQDAVRVTPLPSSARPMVDLGSIDAEGLDPGAILDAAVKALAKAPEGAMARLTIEALDRGVNRAVDWSQVKAARTDLVHLDLRLRLREEGHTMDGTVELGALAQEFDGFMSRHPLAEGDRPRVRAAALEALAAAGGDERAA